MYSPASRQWLLLGTVVICLSIILSANLSVVSAQAPTEGIDLEILVRRPDNVQIRLSGSFSPDVSDGIVRSLEREGIRTLSTGQRNGIHESQLIAQIDLGGVLANGEWTLALTPLLRALDVETLHLRTVHLALPSSFTPSWIGPDPVDTRANRLMYVEYVFNPPAVARLHGVIVAPHEHVNRYLILTCMLGLLPAAAGIVFARLMSRHTKSTNDPDWASIIAVPAIIAMLIPFQTHYTRWISAYLDWRVPSTFWGGVSGFAPLFIVAALSFSPIIQVQVRRLRGQPVRSAIRQRRLILARLFPLIITALINIAILSTTDVLSSPDGYWGFIGIQAGAIALSFAFAPTLAKWAFQVEPLTEQTHPEITRFAGRHGISPQRLFIAPQTAVEPELNAFVMGIPPFNPIFIVTQELLTELSPAEAKAVIAHEISHVTNWHLLQRLVLFFAGLALVPLTKYVAHPNPFLVLPLSSVTLYIVYSILSRYQEYAADKDAGTMAGSENMRTALEKIGAAHSASVKVSRWIWWLQSHPFLDHRLKRLAKQSCWNPPHTKPYHPQ